MELVQHRFLIPAPDMRGVIWFAVALCAEAMRGVHGRRAASPPQSPRMAGSAAGSGSGAVSTGATATSPLLAAVGWDVLFQRDAASELVSAVCDRHRASRADLPTAPARAGTAS